jgi:GntR family transcriptional regulator
MGIPLHTVTVVTINPRSDRPIYRQVADILRDQITSGELAPGALLPSEKQLADTYGVGRDAIRQAIAVLRAEGLTRTDRGRGTVVRSTAERKRVELEPGDRVIARMPTEQEKITMHIDEGLPIVVVSSSSGFDKVYPADATELIVTTNSNGREAR